MAGRQKGARGNDLFAFGDLLADAADIVARSNGGRIERDGAGRFVDRTLFIRNNGVKCFGHGSARGDFDAFVRAEFGFGGGGACVAVSGNTQGDGPRAELGASERVAVHGRIGVIGKRAGGAERLAAHAAGRILKRNALAAADTGGRFEDDAAGAVDCDRFVGHSSLGLRKKANGAGRLGADTKPRVCRRS